MNKYFNYHLPKLVIVLVVLFSAITNVSLAANTPDTARDFIKNLGDQVIDIVASDKIAVDAKEKQLNDMFVKVVDINWVAKFAAGRYWNEATTAQQKNYLDVYKKFLINSYVPKFKQYTGQKMVMGKASMEDEGEYIVETTINDTNGKSYNVSYKIRADKAGSFKIYDIVAEGVSMITTQRSDFGSVLSREGMDSLIAKLSKKE